MSNTIVVSTITTAFRIVTDAKRLVVDIVARPQLKNPCNCLPKTQVSANTKVDV